MKGEKQLHKSRTVHLMMAMILSVTGIDALIASILADIFHEMSKVCKTLSELHTLHDKFGRAFSDTMLVPDKNDKAKVMNYLKAKNLTWEKFTGAPQLGFGEEFEDIYQKKTSCIKF